MSSENFDTKKKIVATAAELLLAGKGEGVRMLDIARGVGISRQAVYLHFPTRGELMIAAVRHLDELYGLDESVKQFREARSGAEIMETFIDFWGNYIPKIYGVAKALMASRGSDEAASAAWADRMNSIRSGCRRTIETIEHEGLLSTEWSIDDAIDLLWAMLSIENWERLTIDRGWTVENYVERMQLAAKKTFLR